jgi:hypothetical protein
VALLVCSLGLNVALAHYLFRPRPGTAARGTSPTTNADMGGWSAASLSTSAPATALGVDGGTGLTAGFPFHWSDIESDDYRRYIANLRGVGCPEVVIRDLIAAELTQLFSRRAASIWERPQRQYWQKWRQIRPDPAQRKQLMALEREQSAVFRELLGQPLSRQALIDLAHLQLHGSEHELLFLAADKREAAMRLLADSGHADREVELRSRSSRYSSRDESKLAQEKYDLLSRVLSPEELTEFRLRFSPTAQSLRVELQYFDCTPEEFGKLLDAREQHPRDVTTGDMANRGPAVEQVRRLFGEERAREFEKTTDLFYQQARRALEELGWPIGRADEAWQIARDARAAAEQIAQDAALPAEARERQIQALRSRAEAQLAEALGERASRAVRRDLGVFLSVSERRIQP